MLITTREKHARFLNECMKEGAKIDLYQDVTIKCSNGRVCLNKLVIGHWKLFTGF